MRFLNLYSLRMSHHDPANQDSNGRERRQQHEEVLVSCQAGSPVDQDPSHERDEYIRRVADNRYQANTTSSSRVRTCSSARVASPFALSRLSRTCASDRFCGCGPTDCGFDCAPPPRPGTANAAPAEMRPGHAVACLRYSTPGCSGSAFRYSPIRSRIALARRSLSPFARTSAPPDIP